MQIGSEAHGDLQDAAIPINRGVDGEWRWLRSSSSRRRNTLFLARVNVLAGVS